MYSFNYLDRIKTSVESKIYLERTTYIKIYETIEEYISQFTSESNVIMLGSSIGINMLLEKERTINDFVYELYTENAFLHSNNLTNKIATLLSPDETHGDIILLKTAIPSIKYQIIVNTRIMAIIFNVPNNSYSLIAPIKTKTFDKKREVLVISPEIALIDIYRTLYSPNKADDWENSLYDETKLSNYLDARLTEIKGSAEPDIDIDIEDRKQLELALLKNFALNNSNIALIGEHALKILLGSEISSTIIQIISQNEIENDFVEIEKVIKATLKKNVPIFKLTRELHIMQDFRIRRTIIKVSQKEIMYIYNSAAYDLIPVNKAKYGDSGQMQIGNPFVLLRFLLIDFWMVRYIEHVGGIDKNFAKQRLNSILKKLLHLRNKIKSPKNNQKHSNIDSQYFDSLSNFGIFQSVSEDYLGFYDDENISQKIIIKDIAKKHYDYYPSDYKKKYNQYRELDKK